MRGFQKLPWRFKVGQSGNSAAMFDQNSAKWQFWSDNLGAYPHQSNKEEHGEGWWLDRRPMTGLKKLPLKFIVGKNGKNSNFLRKLSKMAILEGDNCETGNSKGNYLQQSNTQWCGKGWSSIWCPMKDIYFAALGIPSWPKKHYCSCILANRWF